MSWVQVGIWAIVDKAQIVVINKIFNFLKGKNQKDWESWLDVEVLQNLP